ncbi:MAG: response regulator [Rickettsiales bacterium]|nr:response regulator [Rickettsiales bacterium]
MKVFHILIVDDDNRIRDLLKQFLVKQGYVVTAVYDTEEARNALSIFSFDLIILDVMLPKERGVEFAKYLRNISSVAILMLTALGEVKDRIVGLESGADDYLVKPFDPKELLLRIKRLIDRTVSYETQVVLFGSVKYDLKKSVLIKNNTKIPLTSSEIKLLNYFIEKKNVMVEREELSEILGINVRSVDVQINRLRNKIETSSKKPLFLQSVRGMGYILYVD